MNITINILNIREFAIKKEFHMIFIDLFITYSERLCVTSTIIFE